MYPAVRNAAVLLGQVREWSPCLTGMTDQVILSNLEHLNLTADGLLLASRHSRDGGYSISRSLLHGWQRGYIETTGYILPTVFDLAVFLGRPELRADALRQGEWLLQHQRPDGSFPDITRQVDAAFDTGQVVLGLDRLYAETADDRFLQAARRACEWLASLSQPDGSWAGSDDTRGRCPTYMTRSAAALIAHGQATGNPSFVERGCRFLDWSLTQQLPSGLFRDSYLSPDSPFLLHTVAYVLEGLLDGHALTGHERYLTAARHATDQLLHINLNRDVTLYSLYDADLNAATSEKCLTGLAQWADICLRMFAVTGEEPYRQAASNTLFYLKSKQLRGQGDLRGALPGSIPIWGDYLKLCYPAWNLKFFADALLAAERAGLDQSVQQEVFVTTCHNIHGEAVGWADASTKLGEIDLRVLGRLERTIEAATVGARSPLVVDLGCGEGRFLDWLQARRPGWRFLGVDPLPPSKTDRQISKGTAHRIPLADASAHVVYSAVALQHVSGIEAALAEVRRVLRPDGVFVVFDRNPWSLRGLLKPWHELRGRWLYSWDSPFRERWYLPSKWRSLFRGGGYKVVASAVLSTRDGVGWRRFLPINRFVYVAGQKVLSAVEADLLARVAAVLPG